jgi:hypothetical protein
MIETLPTEVFLDILARVGGWIKVPGKQRPGSVVVTALSVCKQWRQDLLDSPAHAVQLLMRVPAVLARPCGCEACDPSGRQGRWWTCDAQNFRELQHKPLEYALVLAAAIGADAAVQAMLSTMALQQTPATADDLVVRACSGSALVAAAARGHEATVRLLLELRFESCRAGDALARAAGAGHEPIVRLLIIERGLDVERGQDHMLTALQRAARHGQLGTVRLLAAAIWAPGERLGPDLPDSYNALFSAAVGGHADIIALLLPCVNYLELDDEQMDAALVAAARGGSAAAVELLLLAWPDKRAPRADCLDAALLERQEEEEGMCDDDVLEVLQRCMCRIIPRGQRTLEDCWGALVWWAVDGDGEMGGQRRRRVGHFCARDRLAPNGDACCAECMLARRLAPPCDGG